MPELTRHRVLNWWHTKPPYPFLSGSQMGSSAGHRAFQHATGTVWGHPQWQVKGKNDYSITSIASSSTTHTGDWINLTRVGDRKQQELRNMEMVELQRIQELQLVLDEVVDPERLRGKILDADGPL